MSSNTSYTSSCYPIAVQSVRDAISKDSQGDCKVSSNQRKSKNFVTVIYYNVANNEKIN